MFILGQRLFSIYPGTLFPSLRTTCDIWVFVFTDIFTDNSSPFSAVDIITPASFLICLCTIFLNLSLADTIFVLETRAAAEYVYKLIQTTWDEKVNCCFGRFSKGLKLDLEARKMIWGRSRLLNYAGKKKLRWFRYCDGIYQPANGERSSIVSGLPIIIMFK